MTRDGIARKWLKRAKITSRVLICVVRKGSHGSLP
jgi:hypothetical protein